MPELLCAGCGAAHAFVPGETVFDEPIEAWFERRDRLCTPCFTRTRSAVTAAATAASIEQVDENADDAWKREALEAVRLCATRFAEFTADEVWALLERSDAATHEPAALGPVFLRAARAGWIVNTGRRRKRSLYTQRHRELTIWGSVSTAAS